MLLLSESQSSVKNVYMVMCLKVSAFPSNFQVGQFLCSKNANQYKGKGELWNHEEMCFIYYIWNKIKYFTLFKVQTVLTLIIFKVLSYPVFYRYKWKLLTVQMEKTSEYWSVLLIKTFKTYLWILLLLSTSWGFFSPTFEIIFW